MRLHFTPGVCIAVTDRTRTILSAGIRRPGPSKRFGRFYAFTRKNGSTAHVYVAGPLFWAVW